MIQWLADESTAQAEGIVIWCFNSLQMSRLLKLKEQQLVDAIAWAEDDNDNNDEVVEQLQ